MLPIIPQPLEVLTPRRSLSDPSIASVSRVSRVEYHACNQQVNMTVPFLSSLAVQRMMPAASEWWRMDAG